MKINGKYNNTKFRNHKKLKEPFVGNLQPLSKLLPIDTPLSILIDPSNICNFSCIFCPTGNRELISKVKRDNGTMNFKLFCKIIDGIKGFKNKIKKINLHKDGEPFLNKDLVKMITYAKESSVADSINTTTNGYYLNNEKIKEILDSGLDNIKISVEHVHDVGYEKITRTNTKYRKILNNLKSLNEEKEKYKSKLKIFIKINDTGLTFNEKRKFIKDFDPISDYININPMHNWTDQNEYDFSLGLIPLNNMGADNISPLKPSRLVCPEPFTTLAVNFNGLVSICCVDWNMKSVIGDATKNSLVEIWNGNQLKKFRIMHLNGLRRKIKVCSNCQVIHGTPLESDLDDISKSLIEIYE